MTDDVRTREQLLEELAQHNRQLADEVAERERREHLQAAHLRVREQIWAMRKAEDIDLVVAAIANALIALRVPFESCGINILEEVGATVQATIYDFRRESARTRQVQLAEAPAILVRIWREQELVYRRDLHREDRYGELGLFSVKTVRALIDVPFSQGTLAVSSTQPDAFSDTDVETLQDVAVLLTESYQRLTDLRALAGRNRDLEVEVSEHRRTAEELQRAKEEAEEARSSAEAASRAKSTFLANISHEIRTPLNAILGYAQILRGRAGVDDEMRQGLDTIRTSGDHLLGLIGDVLDLSRIESGLQELDEVEFNLARLVDGLADMFTLGCQRKGLEWQVDWRPHRETRVVRGDEGRLRQVLINLLSNAVKYTDEGSVQLTVATDAAVDRVDFAVQDTGPGLPREQLEAIFEPFQRGDTASRAPGTGLGLAIARAHVELMGGQLRVESAPGEGTRFHFALALPGHAAAPASDPSTDYGDVVRLAPGQRVRALVADDVEENREVLRQILERIGVEVTLASDGAEAAVQTVELRPEVVFLDIRMPEADGLEALRRIQDALGEDAPVAVVVSASVLEHDQRTYVEAGFAHFIAKPVRQEVVYAALADLLGVSFERAERVAAVDGAGPPIPADLAQRVRVAAGAGRLTDLNQALEDLRDHGSEALADRLAERARAIDMDSILAILDEAGETA